MSDVRKTLNAYEKLLERAKEIAKVPGFYFENEHICVRVGGDNEHVDVEIFEWYSGWEAGDGTLGSERKSIPIALFEMVDADFAAHKQKLIDDREVERRAAEHAKAMREVRQREEKERAEFERLKAKFGASS